MKRLLFFLLFAAGVANGATAPPSVQTLVVALNTYPTGVEVSFYVPTPYAGCTITQYDLRYLDIYAFTPPLTLSMTTWSKATRVATGTPDAPGSFEQIWIPGLATSKTYQIGVKLIQNCIPTTSLISNVMTVNTAGHTMTAHYKFDPSSDDRVAGYSYIGDTSSTSPLLTGGSGYGTTIGNVNGFEVPGLPWYSEYCAVVFAYDVNNNHSPPSNVACTIEGPFGP